MQADNVREVRRSRIDCRHFAGHFHRRLRSARWQDGFEVGQRANFDGQVV